MAPNSQNHEMRQDRQQQLGPGRDVANARPPCRGAAAAAAASAPAAGGAAGICARREPSRRRRRHTARADDQRAVVDQHDAAAEDGAEQNREERAGLDERVAGDELVVAQVLRQQRVLDRAEHGRVRAEAEERGEQDRHALPATGPTRRGAMMPISATFTQRAIAALSKRSASVPEAPEKRKNGAMNRPPAIITSVAASRPDCSARRKVTKIASALFSRLSLNAPRNWVTKSGANRRVVRSCTSGDRIDMSPCLHRGDRGPCGGHEPLAHRPMACGSRP